MSIHVIYDVVCIAAPHLDLPEYLMLDANLAQQLETHLSKLILPVELVTSLDDTPKSAELTELLAQLSDMSELLTVVPEEKGGDARRPSFAVTRPGTAVSVRFAGIPLGHELTSLVLALLQVGGHPSTADEAVLDQIRNIDGEHHFETYFSLTCQNCPDVVQALNLMSVINPNIHHTAIDGALFQDEVEDRQVLAVPAVFHNGEMWHSGRASLEELVGKINTNAATRTAARLETLDPFDVLVVGGGPAGAAGAIYAARKGIRTGVVTERFGGQVLDTVGIENFISVQYTEGPRMVAALEQHVKDYEVDVMVTQRAAKLIPAAQSPSGFIEVVLDSGATLRSRSVILSTGARWRSMGVPGEQEYRNKGVTYCPHCDGPLFKGTRVAVIGGGNSGAEAAIDLAGVVEHVTLLEFDPQLRADSVLQDKLVSTSNIDVITSALTTVVGGDGERVTGLGYTDRVTGDAHELAVAGVFVQIGLLANTEWLEGAVELSPRGEVIIDNRGATSVPGVFAAGDMTTVPYKQIVIAMGAGATAALSAFDHLIRTPTITAVNTDHREPAAMPSGRPDA